MKYRIEIKQGAINFNAPLLGFRKILYRLSIKIIDIMDFNTSIIYCNVISGQKDNGKYTDKLYTFNPLEPPGNSMKIIPTNVLYQNVAKQIIEYIEFHIRGEHGRAVDFNGDVINFS